MRARYACLSALSIALICLAIGSPSHPSRGASTDPEPELLAAVIRGMEARETLVHHQMHSLKGLWIVEEEDHTARPVRAVSTGSADANNRGPGSTSVVPGKRLPESHSRVYVAVSGERYRQSVRYLHPEGRPPTSLAYDGHVSWLWDGERMGTTRRRTLSGTSAGKFTGLAHVVNPQGEVQLSWRIKEGRPQLAGEEDVLGYRCYVLQYGVPRLAEGQSVGRESMTCCVAPALGYAVVRWEASGTREGASSPTGRLRREYSDFREASPGLWLPFVYEESAERRDAEGLWMARTHLRATALYLKVNVPMQNDEFICPR